MNSASRTHVVILLACCLWPVAVACSDESTTPSQPVAPSGVFGGSAGASTAGTTATAGSSTSGTGGSSGSAGAASRCVDVPVTTVEMIDDFEDGDSAVRSTSGREGFWFLGNDGTGGELEPAIFATETGGPGESLMAFHLKASGFTNYGISLGTALQHTADGLRCPLNAGEFKGVRFDARGPGIINVFIDMPGIVPVEFNGTCEPATESCWDAHMVKVALSDEYRRYELTWDRFVQSGWGKAVEFEPDTVLGVAFGVAPADLPIDFWIDNVSFMLELQDDPTPWGSSGGSGGMGGTGDGPGGAGAGGAGGDGGAAGGAHAGAGGQ